MNLSQGRKNIKGIKNKREKIKEKKPQRPCKCLKLFSSLEKLFIQWVCCLFSLPKKVLSTSAFFTSCATGGPALLSSEPTLSCPCHQCTYRGFSWCLWHPWPGQIPFQLWLSCSQPCLFREYLCIPPRAPFQFRITKQIWCILCFPSGINQG